MHKTEYITVMWQEHLFTEDDISNILDKHFKPTSEGVKKNERKPERFWLQGRLTKVKNDIKT